MKKNCHCFRTLKSYYSYLKNHVNFWFKGNVLRFLILKKSLFFFDFIKTQFTILSRTFTVTLKVLNDE